MRRLVLVLVLALVGGCAAAYAQDGPPLSIRLAGGGGSIVDHTTRSQTIHRSIEVENASDQPVTVQLSPGAARVAGGAFQPRDDAPNDLVAWTSVSPPTLALDPGATAAATVTITVPDDAGAGERYGFVWATAGASRAGLRIYLSVGPGTAPARDFSITSIEARRAQDGTPLVVAHVRNTQHRALDLRGELRLLNGPGERSAGPFRTASDITLGIDQSASMRLPVDRGVPAGPWDAQLLVRAGPIAHEVTAQLRFPSRPGSSAGAIKTTIPRGTTSGFVVLIVVALVVAGGSAALVVSRRRAAQAG